MDYLKMIETMSPELYSRLKRSVELGKWPDGRPLTAAQREHALQAVIAWGQLHLDASKQTGFIDKGHKAGSSCDDPEIAPLSWRDQEQQGSV